MAAKRMCGTCKVRRLDLLSVSMLPNPSPPPMRSPLRPAEIRVVGRRRIEEIQIFSQVVANGGGCSALFGSGHPLVIGPSERERRSRAKNGRALPEKLDKVLARQDHGRLKR